jgi:putative transposase
VFERSLEQTRPAYLFYVLGYVVMPEHVHLLLTEPQTKALSSALQALKQSVSRSLALRAAEPFWQTRYYDFNVWSEDKRVEKLRYMHRNPVVRGLVARPEEWAVLRIGCSYRDTSMGKTWHSTLVGCSTLGEVLPFPNDIP